MNLEYFNKYEKYYESLKNNLNMVNLSSELALECSNIYNVIISICFNSVSESPWNESGKSIVVNSIFENMKQSITMLKDFISNNLVKACDLSINSLLPKIEEIRTKNIELDDIAEKISIMSEEIIQINESLANTPRWIMVTLEDGTSVQKGNERYMELSCKLNELHEQFFVLCDKNSELTDILKSLCMEADEYINDILSLDALSSDGSLVTDSIENDDMAVDDPFLLIENVLLNVQALVKDGDIENAKIIYYNHMKQLSEFMDGFYNDDIERFWTYRPIFDKFRGDNYYNYLSSGNEEIFKTLDFEFNDDFFGKNLDEIKEKLMILDDPNKVKYLVTNPYSHVSEDKLVINGHVFDLGLVYNESLSEKNAAQVNYLRSIVEDCYKELPDGMLQAFEDRGVALVVAENGNDFLLGETSFSGLTYSKQIVFTVTQDDEMYTKNTVEHETGHMIDNLLNKCSSTDEWKKLCYDEIVSLCSLTCPYVAPEDLDRENSSEFFAGAVDAYLSDREELEKLCPNTYNAVDKIFNDFGGM